MKRDKSFYYVFVMFLFVTCYITCYILSNRTIEFGGMIATASAMIYPFTYFIAVLFYERYGKNRVFELIKIEASRYGVPVVGSEIIGLVPMASMIDTAAWYLQVEDFDISQVLESQLLE